ncbi:hypothetical protein [Martelella soudanensis]|uniref:hypothetical protein n=1 Tax=unclassified Martelella TaxID=2629616 RepID=UPI0015DE0828|nr:MULTISPECIES: hypothetical protein [unclassified Martelella]
MTDISTDLSPRAACHLVSVAGFCFCRCGWSDHPLSEHPCREAHEEAVDAHVRELIESGTDWRWREQFSACGSELTSGLNGGAA